MSWIGALSFICHLLGLVPSYTAFGPAASFFRSLLILGFVLWLLSFIVVEVIIAVNSGTSPDSDDADYLVVLGAGLFGSTPSPTLKSRLDRAVEYARTNPDTVIVVSGGQGPGEDIPESEAMRKYLVDRGIEPERILEENISTSTTENLRFSFLIIDSLRKNDESPKIAVLSNEYHLFRAGYIAVREGKNVSLVAARTPYLYLKITYYVREYFALLYNIVFRH